ncbi:MAG TPA: response regulator transcription factor [Candidatus Pullichristensenella stercoripullorum]|nr:response regulator transcription factor [Candidatus Pullichristensenella stercoripullorum]
MDISGCPPLRLAICDDEPMDCALVAQMSREILGAEGVEAELSAYPSAAELLRAIRAGRAFHIFLLDVMMEGMDGMELAAALRAGHEDAAIIFISSNREMALRGYEVAAARYLAKPLDREKLREALLYCCAAHARRRALALPTADGQTRVDPSAILYVEAWERGVRLDLGGEKLEAKIPISQIAAMLPEGQFAYCHRTLLVNLACVRHVRYCELELKNGERLPISKYRLAQFKSEFLKYPRD